MSLLKKPCYTKQDGYTTIQRITREESGLQYIEFQVLEIQKNNVFSETLDGLEACVVILEGTASIEVNGQHFEQLGTRKELFSQIPTDSIYIPHTASYSIVGEENCKVAICYAPTEQVKTTTVLYGNDIVPEHRGKGNNQRTVFTVLSDTSTVSDKLLVVEVFTPSGNWSSYPPHKHDQDNLPHESLLEETYFHAISPSQGFVFQRVYTEDGSLDETMAVYHEDVVLVPKGYHPVAVPEGYQSYYLNVMAGPKKVWKFHNEKAHEWILNT